MAVATIVNPALFDSAGFFVFGRLPGRFDPPGSRHPIKDLPFQFVYFL